MIIPHLIFTFSKQYQFSFIWLGLRLSDSSSRITSFNLRLSNIPFIKQFNLLLIINTRIYFLFLQFFILPIYRIYQLFNPI